MTTASPLYGTTSQMTISLTGLASSGVAGRQSTVVDNVAADAVDAIVGGKITTSGTPTNGRQIEVWAFGSYDDTEFTGGAGAADAALTPDNKTSLRLLAVMIITSTAGPYRFGPCSIAAAFDGVMPERWGIWVTHNCVTALSATPADHEVWQTPVNYESA